MNHNDRAVTVTASGIWAMQSKKLSSIESKVLWWVVANLPVGGGVLRLKDIQDHCGITDRANAGRCLQSLFKAGFVRRMAKVQRSYFYTLNPNWFQLVL